MEQQLLGILLKSRESYNKVYPLLDQKLYSREFRELCKLITAYYQRDSNAAYVDPGILTELIASTYDNDKHVRTFKQIIEEACAAEVSVSNVEATVIAAKRNEIEQRIALSCVNKDGKLADLYKEWQALESISTLDELTAAGATIIERIDLDALVAERTDRGVMIQILPRVINDRLDGGLLPGHHMTVFARPEMGKSLTVISIGGGVVRQGFKVLHVENEDRPSDVQMRYVSNLSGMTRREILNDPARARRAAETNGLEQITVAELTPGNPAQIEELVARYEPDLLIVNQLRNLYTGEQNKVLALENAATACRNIGKVGGCAVVSVTQAGDSADGKAYLEMGDVDFSNTGIPAQCDVLMGVGATPAMVQEGTRGISFPKNKVGEGRESHDPVIVKVRPEISRMLSPTARPSSPDGS